MQLKLPIFPSGSILVSPCLGVHTKDNVVTWIVNALPVYQHAEDDHRSFRFALSNFIRQGLCRPVDVMRAFDVGESFVQRACKTLEQKGEAGFFQKTSRKGSNYAIIESDRQRIQGLLDQGRSVNSIATELGFPESTIRSYIKQGYLKKRIKRK